VEAGRWSPMTHREEVVDPAFARWTPLSTRSAARSTRWAPARSSERSAIATARGDHHAPGADARPGDRAGHRGLVHRQSPAPDRPAARGWRWSRRATSSPTCASPRIGQRRDRRPGAVLRADDDQLAALDRMKAEFVSVASHELKTPLSVIKGYVSLLRDGVYGECRNSSEDPDLGGRADRSAGPADPAAPRREPLRGRWRAAGDRPVDLRAFLDDLAAASRSSPTRTRSISS
jgi:signal transduction histidine kinase